MSHADTARHPTVPDLRLAATVIGGLALLLAVLFGLDWLLRKDTLPVRQVRFEGEFKRVTRAELEAAVMETVRGNVLALDLDTVRARVEALPWVYSASVRRQWPHDVHVRFTEERLVARWGANAWLNHEGGVVEVNADDLPTDAPRLEGPEGTGPIVLRHFDEFNRLLAPAGLAATRLVLTPRRTWELELNGGLRLVIDRHAPHAKLTRFARVYALWLAPQAARLRQLDLRYTNGFAVAWRSGTEVSYGEKR